MESDANMIMKSNSGIFTVVKACTSRIKVFKSNTTNFDEDFAM